MPKINRGTTTKLSIRLSAGARQKISKAAENLGISLAGVIIFELTKILKNPPSLSEIEQLEEEISLERNHFVMTVNEKLMKKINSIAIDYDMRKNVLVGLIVSNHFVNMDDLEKEKDLQPKKLMVQINETLKKKMMEYSEENYIPLGAIIGYSILNGPYEKFPKYEDGEAEKIFINVPEYIGQMVKEGAEELNIREHFYTSLCIYKQFMVPGGRFF